MAFLNKRSTKDSIKSTVKKASSSKPTRSSVKSGLVSTIKLMIENAQKHLAIYKDEYIVIRTEDELNDYLSSITEGTLVAIDTETTSLDPLTTQIAGVCLYYKGAKPCYIPLNHKSHITGERFKNQVDLKLMSAWLSKLEFMSIKWIMHNADFDIRVIKHTLGTVLTCYWDTLLAAKMIDENEPAALKELHLRHCNSHDKEALTFSKLFEGVEFTNVPIDTAYLYAAGDPLKTFDVFDYQFNLLSQPENKKVLDVLLNIEMPLVKVVIDMEDLGMSFDFEISKNLHDKYTAIREDRLQKANLVIDQLGSKITAYKLKNPGAKIDIPVNLSSPSQLAILLYDILKVQSPDPSSPRGTGEEILSSLANQPELADLCKCILDLREVEKLLNTYIDKMPQLAERDGRIHTRFNQIGAKTGRFSSSDPNLQNIPSHNKEIRQMFKATDGYLFIGADYSKQEIFIAASISEDEKMIASCKKNTDIYSEIASIAFGLPYEDCVEFRTDGSKNAEGKERRSQAKAIVLGILYGKGVASIAADLNITKERAQQVYDDVLQAFPKLKDFMHTSQQNARDFGYVETAWGRRRHLPDMQLDPYEFSLVGNTPLDFDPLCFEISEDDLIVPQRIKKEYLDRLDKCRGFKAKENIKAEALKAGIKIKDNGGFIAQAERQCVNSRVQGSAGDLTKLAMIKIRNDELMKEWDFHLLLTIHDEVIGECPIENAKKCSERLAQLMISVGVPMVAVPLKVDTEITRNWYGEVIELGELE